MTPRPAGTSVVGKLPMRREGETQQATNAQTNEGATQQGVSNEGVGISALNPPTPLAGNDLVPPSKTNKAGSTDLKPPADSQVYANLQ